LPFTADMHGGEFAGTERSAFDRKTALLLYCEPVSFHGRILPRPFARSQTLSGQHLSRRRPTGQKGLLHRSSNITAYVVARIVLPPLSG
jgi:hypothetical protein